MIGTLRSGAFGIGSALAAAGFTLTAFEQWLRIAGGLVALAVAVVTLWKIVREIQRMK